MNRDSIAETVRELGFTSLEAEGCVVLLEESPATGYRVAQVLGKPVANVYKAVESLRLKGAVLVDDGETRLCRATPAEELLDAIERQFREKKERAGEALSRIGRPKSDDRLYRLATRDQVLERLRGMFGRAEWIVLIDAFPEVLEYVREEAAAAAARGVKVVCKTYADDAELEGAHMIRRPRPHEITDGFPGAMIVCNVDGSEHLIATLAEYGDEIHTSIWTSNPILSFDSYGGMINEFTLTAMMIGLETAETVDELRELFASYRPYHPMTSKNFVYQRFLENVRGPGEAARKETDR